MGWIARLAQAAVTQPIARPVPNDDAFFAADKGRFRLAQRVAKRRVEVVLAGQARLEAARWAPAWRRAIWYHAEAPQIGDSLLDLAPRSLLAERGIAVDVVLPAATAGVFRGDRWFAAVLGEDVPVAPGRYDVAIVDSHCGKALAGKRRWTPALPWLSVRGDYLAYDYQRGMLAARRFAELLGAALAPADELLHARQKLDVAGTPPPSADAAGRVAITLGGVRPERTYRAWPAVAQALDGAGHRRFTLLGSGNGAEWARAVREAIEGADVLDLVGRTDIPGTQQAMAAARLVLCVDGGLMHLACTTTTPMLGLFDRTSLPVWRVPLDWDGTAIVSPSADVNGIDARQVIATALALLSRPLSP